MVLLIGQPVLPAILQSPGFIRNICPVDAMGCETEQNKRSSKKHCADRVEFRARNKDLKERQETDRETDKTRNSAKHG